MTTTDLSSSKNRVAKRPHAIKWAVLDDCGMETPSEVDLLLSVSRPSPPRDDHGPPKRRRSQRVSQDQAAARAAAKREKAIERAILKKLSSLVGGGLPPSWRPASQPS